MVQSEGINSSHSAKGLNRDYSIVAFDNAQPPAETRTLVAERPPVDALELLKSTRPSAPVSSPPPPPSSLPELSTPSGPSSSQPFGGTLRFSIWPSWVRVLGGTLSGAALQNLITMRWSDIEAATRPQSEDWKLLDMRPAAQNIIFICQTQGVEAAEEAFIELYNHFEVYPGMAEQWQFSVWSEFLSVDDPHIKFDPYALIQELAQVYNAEEAFVPDDYMQWLLDQAPMEYQYFFGSAAVMAGQDHQSGTCPELWRIREVPALYDPYGAFSRNVVRVLERNGAAAWRQPLYSLAMYSHRSEQSMIDSRSFKMGDPLLVPRSVGDMRRPKIPLQILIPTSQVLKNYFTSSVASRLHRCAVMVSAIKGLVEDGSTPREYIRRELNAAGRRAVPSISIYGYAPSGDFPNMEKQHIVLATDNERKAWELAQRWIGSNQKPKFRRVNGARVAVFTRKKQPWLPSLRIVVVSDPHLVQANEFASIYKNIMAIDLGMKLFDEMVRISNSPHILKGEAPEHYLHRFYAHAMQRAIIDIESAIKAEGVKTPIILEEVKEDLRRSWDVKGNTSDERNHNMRELYQVVDRAFGAKSRHDRVAKQKALEIKSGEALAKAVAPHYSVRNPRYGFLLAAERREKRSFIPESLIAEGVTVAQFFGKRDPNKRFPPSFTETAEAIAHRFSN